MITNCLLIFAIIRYTTHALGSYKQLLLIFAFYDVFLVSLHAVLKPVRNRAAVTTVVVFFAFLLFFKNIRIGMFIAYSLEREKM